MSGLNRTISSHEAPQSGHDGYFEIHFHASSLNQGGGGETNLCDRSAVAFDRFRKAYVLERDESYSLKIRLIPGPPGIFNSWVMIVILLRSL